MVYTSDLVRDGIDKMGAPGRRPELAVRERDMTLYSSLRRYFTLHRLVICAMIGRIVGISSLAT